MGPILRALAFKAPICPLVNNVDAAPVTSPDALLDGLELKPRKAFGPIRVAVTGSTVSPPLFESLELLGRERSLARLRDAPRTG